MQCNGLIRMWISTNLEHRVDSDSLCGASLVSAVLKLLDNGLFYLERVLMLC